MTFASPALLWSLLALLPLVAIYFLKVRPRRQPATAYFLWEKIFNEKRANRLWQRLRSLWSLLIMALAFIAVALAMGDPRLEDADRQDLLLVIDTSLSMQAKDASGNSRLELAKQRAVELAQSLDGVQKAAVASVSNQLRYESHLTDNPRELIAAIRKIEPTYAELDPTLLPTANNEKATSPDKGTIADQSNDGPSAIASPDKIPSTTDDKESLAGQPRSHRRTLFLTDRVLTDRILTDQVPTASEQQPGDADSPATPAFETLIVGDEAANIGLIAADLQFIAGEADRLSFYFQVASSQVPSGQVDSIADETTNVDLLLYFEQPPEEGTPTSPASSVEPSRELAKVIPLEIKPGISPPQIISVDGAKAGRWVAELDYQDALAADNTVYLVARRPPPVRMEVVSEDRYFLEQSVAAFANSTGALQLVDANAEVVLTHGSSDAPRAVIMQPAGESPFWQELGAETPVGAAKPLVEDHPVLRHTDVMSMNFAGARELTPPAGAQVLVVSDTGVPLIYLASTAEQRALVLNLDPLAADFYFSAWFPVMVHSAAKHLAGRETLPEPVYKPGDRAPLAATIEDEEDATKEASLILTPNGDSVAAGTSLLLKQPGFYQLANNDALACSPLFAEETLLNNQGKAEEPAKLASGGPLSRWFIMLALAAVTAESVLYHRRKVG